MLVAARNVLRQQQGFLASLAPCTIKECKGTAGFASSAPPPEDYALALQAAHELTKTKPGPSREAGYLTGVPMETFNRYVRIYVPTRSPEQAAYGRTLHPSNHSPTWKLEFSPTSKWINPLMGWTSTADPLENTTRAALAFFTKEEAINFCSKHGWSYTVEEPLPRRTARPKKFLTYGDNFSVKRKGYPDLTHLPSNRAAE